MGLLPGGKARKEQAKILKMRNAARRRMAQRSEG